MDYNAPRHNVKPYAGLPLEIWSGIIRSFDARSFPHAWFSLRRVSKPIREATEHALRTHYLPQVRIKYDLGLALRPGAERNDWDRCRAKDLFSMDVDMRFSHLSEDGARAYFVDANPPGSERAQELQRVGLAGRQSTRWRKEVRSHMGKVNSHGYEAIPPHRVILGWRVSDNPLPELQLDEEKREISFSWKPLMDEFLNEHHLIEKLQEEDVHQFNLSHFDGQQPLSTAGIWRRCASDNYANRKPLDLPREIIGQLWEHIVRKKRMERWLGKCGGRYYRDHYMWWLQIDRVGDMQQVRDMLYENSRPRDAEEDDDWSEEDLELRPSDGDYWVTFRGDDVDLAFIDESASYDESYMDCEFPPGYGLTCE